MKNNLADAGTFVEVTHLGNGNIYVLWGYDILKKREENGVFSCYIPSFDVYYGASNEEMVEKKGNAITQSFFDNFFIHDVKSMKNPIKYMALDLVKKGFKENMMTMKNIVKDNMPVNARFKSVGTNPKDFDGAERTHKVSKREVVF